MSIPQGRFNFDIERTKRPASLTSYAGLPLLTETAVALGMAASVEQHLGVAVNSQAFSPWEIVDGFVSAIAVGAKNVEDVARLGDDLGALRLLGKQRFGSDTTFWRFLRSAHELPTWQAGKEGEAILPKESRTLRNLEQVGLEQVAAVQKRLQLKRATVDHDATIIESHKAEALAHYDKGRGYQPWVAVWSEANLIVADEFREGNVPAATNPLAQVQKAIWALPPGIEKICFRADSAMDSPRALRWLDLRDITFAVSADMTGELRAAIEKLPETAWRRLMKRDQWGHDYTDSDIAEVEYVTNGQVAGKKKSRPFRYLAIRKREEQGRLFPDGQKRFYLAMVSNDWEQTAENLWWWHKEKCGTIELVHDVMKNDLAAGVMPCGRFQANAAWFRLNVLTYNLISAMKQLALPAQMDKMRPSTLRYRFLNLAGSIVEHARRLILKLPWADDMMELYRQARERLWSGVPEPSPVALAPC